MTSLLRARHQIIQPVIVDVDLTQTRHPRINIQNLPSIQKAFFIIYIFQQPHRPVFINQQKIITTISINIKINQFLNRRLPAKQHLTQIFAVAGPRTDQIILNFQTNCRITINDPSIRSVRHMRFTDRIPRCKQKHMFIVALKTKSKIIFRTFQRSVRKTRSLL